MRRSRNLVLLLQLTLPLAAQATSPSAQQQLRQFAAGLEDLLVDDERVLDDCDLDVLEDAGLRGCYIHLRNPAATVALLRLLRSIPDDALPLVEQLGVEAAAQEDYREYWTAASMGYLLLQHHRFAQAAHVFVAMARQTSREQRANGMLRLVVLGFCRRDDCALLLKSLSLALLDRFAAADAEERLVIADLLGAADTTAPALAELRQKVERDIRGYEAYRRQQLAAARTEAAHAAEMWVQDYRGLRLVDRAAWQLVMGEPQRCELRLLRRDADGVQRDWGVLGSTGSMHLDEMQRWLLELAAIAGDPAADLGSRFGVIAVYQRPSPDDEPDLRRLRELQGAVADAVSQAAMARLAVEWASPPVAENTVQLELIVRELLPVVRAAAERTAQLTLPQRRGERGDAAGDAPVIAALCAVGAQARALAVATKIFSPEAAAGEWQDMGWTQTTMQGSRPMQRSGRTRIRIDELGVTAVEFCYSRESNRKREFDAKLLTISRAALLAGEFAVRDARHPPDPAVMGATEFGFVSGKAIPRRSISLPSEYSSGWLHGDTLEQAWLRCDTDANRLALVRAVLRCAKGEAR